MVTRLTAISSHGIGQNLFPSFSVDFVSDGDMIIPRQKGIISTWQNGMSFWDVVLGAGKIWKEAGDRGWDRASFPITLVSRKSGQAKNCVGVFNERITDYVCALASHPGWQGVTFSHVLNMVTGTAGRDDKQFILPLIFSPSAEEGIEAVSNLGDAPDAPGEKFNYASTITFVLSYAMQKYVEREEGKGIHYWDLVRENVLKPIKADYLALQHTEESDGSKGIPMLAWGAFPTIDEAARIALLLSNEGEYDGQQLLHKGKIREALHRTKWHGYVAYPSRNDHPRNYSHSFWSHYIPNDECKLKIIYMLGQGGNYVTLLPSKVILIRFWDKMDYYIDPLVLAVEEIRASCE